MRQRLPLIITLLLVAAFFAAVRTGLLVAGPPIKGLEHAPLEP